MSDPAFKEVVDLLGNASGGVASSDSTTQHSRRAPGNPASPGTGPGPAPSPSAAGVDARAAEVEHQIPGGSDVEALDAALTRLAVERGLVTAEEVDECLRKKARKKSAKPLERFLLNAGYVTESQLARLRPDLEAERRSRRISGFAVLGTLGSGSAATVYKARQLNLDRLVALKVLPPRTLADEGAIDQFRAEARAAAQLNHPNIVQAFDVGRSGDVHYIVMEYVEGRTVHDLVKSRGAMSEAESLDVAIRMAEALKHAHDRGFVHRDVKPKNIIIHGPTDTPKLTDMGLARLIADRALAMAEMGRTLGTPYYISPEQVRGDLHIGPASDIYSLGATFYFMLAGRPPFEGKDVDDVMDKHLHAPLVPPIELVPEMTHGVSEVIEKMMAKRELERYQDCGELLTELRAWKAYHVLKMGETQR